MDFLNILAGLAAILLGFELLVVVLIIAAVCGGIWFGLLKGDQKASIGFAKLHRYLEQVRNYERLGLRTAVKPVILLYGLAEAVAVTVQRLVEHAQDSNPS